MEKCKEMVSPKERWGSFHQYQCTRKTWKDGYCKTHHPDTVKVRQEESRKRYEEKMENSEYMKLKRANECIKELEAEVERLKKCLENRN